MKFLALKDIPKVRRRSFKKPVHVTAGDVITDLLEPLGGVDWWPLDEAARAHDATLNLSEWEREQRQRGISGLSRYARSIIYAANTQTNDAA